ncbi:LysR substrate-binding domain-containing protein [Ramlibacter albus]|uniref:LysR family transcriptional regulator n=1 Tax=Ramlibacter albus TaxID=2079448 RepID=A0A923S355_9BURK|nr:LysR substrate-binding domain-containing protein [Ramlibacter albus]MBC5766056.1 LysR family transcriptional regulator [Ramlibacter albus]
MNLRQMEVFRAVMVSGGVNTAAALLHVSPPAISKVLAQAAKSTGLVLFERVRGRLIPTPEAQQLYEEVERLWRGVETVRDFSRDLAQPRQATLRLACTASLAPYLASRALAQTYEKVPRLQCRVRVLGPDVLNDHLLQRESHIGIALGPHDHPNLEKVKSYRCGLACVMRTGHKLAAKKRIAPKDLVGERVISSPENTPFGQTLKRAFGEYAADMHRDLDCTSSTTACWFAQAGVGVAVVDQASIAGGVLAGLEVRPFQSGEQLEVRIIRNRYRPMSVPERTFVEVFDEVWRSALGKV